MKTLGLDAVGVGERDLRYGPAFLRAESQRRNLPVVCANLVNPKTHRPWLAPSRMVRVGTVKVGIFGLIGDKANLGPGRDSLQALEPAVVAGKTVAALRKSGADVVLLLSQLGKIETEDLVTTVEGIDAVVVGHDVPVLMKGRTIKNTVACYGGEQGQFMCETILSLDAKRRVTTGQADAVTLSPEVGDKPEIVKVVRAFEDGYNERMRQVEATRQASVKAAKSAESPDHRYLGDAVCARCHATEATQWKTTAHSLAWSTLVNAKKEATPECVACHTVGFGKPTGFTSAEASPHLLNVQCENCHGMGTEHGSGATATARITEQTCMQCHNKDRDPDFDFAKKFPLIVHSNSSGESIRIVESRRGANGTMMKEHGSN